MNVRKGINFIKENKSFYSDGFSELLYLFNSPQQLVQSIVDSPWTKHIEEEQTVYRNDLFSDGVMRYRKIEEGFWVIASSIAFRKNGLLKAVYDKVFPGDYYSLTYFVFESDEKLKNGFADKMTFSSKYWGLNKPGAKVRSYFYKGSVCEFYLYGFSKDWAERNFFFSTLPEENRIKKFLNSDNGFVTYQDVVPNAAELSKEILINLESNKNDLFSKSILKTQAFQLVSTFFKNASLEQSIGNYMPIESPDYQKIAQAENLLSNAIADPFLGVEYIAQKVGMSPTKLKLTFKSVHGISMMQYHKEKKLLISMQMIQNTDMQIKSIALATGYKSSSKFTANFKKRFGKMPSEVRL